MKRYLRIGLWTAAIAWLILCLYLSWQNGSDTVKTSQSVSSLLGSILSVTGISVDADAFHALIRKWAHMGIFLVADFLCSLAWLATFSPAHWKRSLLEALGLSLLVAFMAEAGKVFIDGRHFQLDELGLNWIGALIPYLVFRIWITKRKKPLRGLES